MEAGLVVLASSLGFDSYENRWLWVMFLFDPHPRRLLVFLCQDATKVIPVENVKSFRVPEISQRTLARGKAGSI